MLPAPGQGLPHKLFLWGEYAAVLGHDGLVWTFEPRIQGTWIWESVSSGPVGRLQQEAQVTRRFQVLNGLPGAGLSGAEFLELWRFLGRPWPQGPGDVWDLWLEWKKYRSDFESGYDWVSQSLEPVGFWVLGARKRRAVCTPWPWANWGFVVIPTGQKVHNHEFLPTLPPAFWQWVDEKLAPLSSQITQVWLAAIKDPSNGNLQNQWLQGLILWQDFLRTVGLESLLTHQWVDELSILPGVVLAKGLGTLGADFVWVIVDETFKRDPPSLVQRIECLLGVNRVIWGPGFPTQENLSLWN